MSKMRLLIAALTCSFLLSCGCSADHYIPVDAETYLIKSGDKVLLGYQHKPMTNPKGGEKFKGSNFIHPLNTPSGFTLTDLQPSDHLHHFGLWWPWKFLKVEGRKLNCWELQQGQGLIQAQGLLNSPVTTKELKSFLAESHYIDRTAPDGPKVVLKETLIVTVSPIVQTPANGYYLDMRIIQSPAVDTPVEVVKYRYSGFSIRGTAKWNKTNSTLLTSQGKDRNSSNYSRGNWVLAQGDTDTDTKAGFLMMSHPSNPDTPQNLRTWNDKMYNGTTFINFNPVQKKSWILQPGKKYTQKYRLFVYDGTINKDQAEKIWQDFVK